MRIPALLLASLLSFGAAAQSWPQKPVRFIVPFAPGGATDIAARRLGEKLSQAWGQTVLVENRAGAGGALGAAEAARSAPDGYTLFMANNSTNGSNPAVYPKLPYDAVNDFAPIAFVASVPYVLVVDPSLPSITDQFDAQFRMRFPGDGEHSAGQAHKALVVKSRPPQAHPHMHNHLVRLAPGIVRSMRSGRRLTGRSLGE